MVFLASGQYTLSMRTYAPFRNVVRSNQRHDKPNCFWDPKEEEFHCNVAMILGYF